ncbi:unnamed protein product [Toxocara canis]|uniref:Uncharacterized protein n=1 Tax=Toxocara canis TaxID=6265 RepID=A0A183UJR4_TOXCA|nr:unnamed protein product [Toxocara canis]
MFLQLEFLIEKLGGGDPITKQMYNDLDAGIDYGCIFTTGCLDECNKCPLCLTGKEQLIDVLSGNKRTVSDECPELVNCATDCVLEANANFTMINHCLRHECAFHCFDGSCPKCSAFITRIFNQICVSADLKKRFKGVNVSCVLLFNFTYRIDLKKKLMLNITQCYQIFRSIVFAKFEEQFKKAGKKPAIGVKTI